MFQFQIEISKSKTGGLVNIDITSSPNSRVFLFATDMSGKYLQPHNGFDKYKTSAEVATHAFILTNIGGDAQRCIAKRNVYAIEDDEDEYEDEEDLKEEFEDYGIFGDIKDSKIEPADQKLSQLHGALDNSWIFHDIEINQTGKATLTYSMPVSMSSFSLSGFSIHPIHGFAFASSQKITTSMGFFINVNLPYSIRWGEVLKFTVTVFNYMPNLRSIFAEVTFYNKEKEFEFVGEVLSNSSSCFKKLDLDQQTSQTEQLSVESQSGASTSFLIRASNTGSVKLNFLVRSGGKSQLVEKTLLVESEQTTETRNFPHLIDLRTKSSEQFDFTFHIPKAAIWKSIKIEATATGGLFKSTPALSKKTL